MGDNYIYNVKTSTANNQAANKSYVDTTATNTMNAAAFIHATKAELNDYLKKDGSLAMTGNLDMNNKQINNLSLPTGSKQPTTSGFTDLKYLRLDRTVPIGGNLNMNNKKIMNLLQPTDNTDAATKKYVDDSKVNVSNYLKQDGTSSMTGNLIMENHKIVNLNDEPTTGTDAVNKNYIDSVVASSHVKPSHFKDQFASWMSNVLQWTDEMDGGNSFVMTKIANLSPSHGNFHTYNHKVIYTTIIKNSQGGYKYKMSANCYTQTLTVDYTLCIEILNTDYQLWHKSKVSVDKTSSQRLTIENDSVKKFTQRYTDSKKSNALHVLSPDDN